MVTKLVYIFNKKKFHTKKKGYYKNYEYLNPGLTGVLNSGAQKLYSQILSLVPIIVNLESTRSTGCPCPDTGLCRVFPVR